MLHLFSSANRFHTWRKLWLNLALAEKELGLPISDEAIEQMKANLVRIPSLTHTEDRTQILRILCSISPPSNSFSPPTKK
jgi:adenylosuccinate lyase